MSVETDTDDRNTDRMHADSLASDLGCAIRDLPAYETFEAKKRAVENDDAAQEQITQFESIRSEFMQARQSGQADQSDLRELQAAQEELHELPIMREYLAAQSELELRLQELNQVISAELVVDFGEKAGGCCQD